MLSAKIQLPQSRTLLWASVLYIGLPYLAFFLGWVKWQYSLPACALLAYCFWQIRHSRRTDADASPVEGSVRSISAVVLLLGLWLVGSGVGGLAAQNWDYAGHDAKLFDLVEHSWPVTYEVANSPGTKIHLVYYVAYYLPAALIGKLGAGLAGAQIFNFAWTFAGLLLAAAWIFHFLGRVAVWPIVAFILFSGLDYWGFIAVQGQMPELGRHLEWWAERWQFPATTSQLNWVPNQALPGWILTGAFVNEWRRGRSDYLGLLACLAVLWSAFVALGLLALAIAGTLALDFRLRKWLNIPNLLGALVIGGISSLYLMAKVPNPFPEFLLRPGVEGRSVALALAFLLLEVGLYVLLVAADKKGLDGRFRWLFWLAAGAFPFLLIYRYGNANELAMRTSIPFLYVLFLGLVSVWQRTEKRWLKIAIMFVWLLGALCPLQEIYRAVHYDPPMAFRRRGMLELRAAYHIDQYVARRDAFFFTHLARPSAARRIPARPSTLEMLRKQGLIEP